jgi:hypothetical protein
MGHLGGKRQRRAKGRRREPQGFLRLPTASHPPARAAPNAMVDEIKDHARSRKLPRWAKLLLCLALVPVMLIGPLVVIALWPGLNFELYIRQPSPTSRGFSIQRSSMVSSDGLILRMHSCEAYWSFVKTRKASPGERGWRVKHFPTFELPMHSYAWQGEHHRIGLSRYEY